MASFTNGIGERVRRDNWEQIVKVARRKGLALSSELADGVIKVRACVCVCGGGGGCMHSAHHWQ